MVDKHEIAWVAMDGKKAVEKCHKNKQVFVLMGLYFQKWVTLKL